MCVCVFVFVFVFECVCVCACACACVRVRVRVRVCVFSLSLSWNDCVRHHLAVSNEDIYSLHIPTSIRCGSSLPVAVLGFRTV